MISKDLVKLHGSINKSSMWLNEQKKLGIHFPSHNDLLKMTIKRFIYTHSDIQDGSYYQVIQNMELYTQNTAA